ncbi:MAG: hypothetical protein DRN37_01105, partial [Thermoplasmata archaeon]
MSPEDEDIELDVILSVLENPVRREILKRLSRETNYPLQLSKELNVSQQALMKHLKVLEENEFVESTEEKSDKGGPPRKVYSPKRRYCIRIDIGPNTYQEEFYTYKKYDIVKKEFQESDVSYEKQIEIKGKVTGEMKDEVVAALPAFTDPDLEKIRIKLEEIVNETNYNVKINELKLLVQEIENNINTIETKRKRLLALKERTNQEINTLISHIS